MKAELTSLRQGNAALRDELEVLTLPLPLTRPLALTRTLTPTLTRILPLPLP